MNYMVKLICVLFFLQSLLAQSNDCRLIIKTNSKTALILIADSLCGIGEASTLTSCGSQDIYIKQNPDQWDSQVIVDTVYIGEVSTITKEYYFDDEIYVSSEPDDVYLHKESKLIGHTPLFLSSKLNNITASKPNYSDKMVDVVYAQPIQMNFDGIEKRESFLNSNLFKILIGSAIVLGGTAAHFKIKADKNYEKYLSTNDGSYLESTNDFDTLSGIAFGALQVNFGVLLYYLIFE